jgi:hypothetical protein
LFLPVLFLQSQNPIKMKSKKPKYKIRKVAGKSVWLDPQDFYDPKIFNSSLMLVGGRRVVICDFKNKKYFSLPRFILKPPKDRIVDHINRNPLDNRRCNLRIVDARQSSLNRRLKSNTGRIGVSKTKRTKRGNECFYEAYFQPRTGKRKKFYAPPTPKGLLLAALARDKFVIECGDHNFTPLNFPLFKTEPFKSVLLRSDLNEYKQEISSKGRRKLAVSGPTVLR